MSKKNISYKENKVQPNVETIKSDIIKKVEDIIEFCCKDQEKNNFFSVEKELKTQISKLACLFFQLFLMSFHERFNYSAWLDSGLYYEGEVICRTIKTIYGKVRYWRQYLICKKGGGCYPLDIIMYPKIRLASLTLLIYKNI